MIKKSLLYFIPIVLITVSSCKKTLDINTDPNNPVTISVDKLLPGVEQGLGNALAMGGGNIGGISNDLAVYTHQLSTRESPDKYGVTGEDFFVQTNWLGIYTTTLSNLEDIIRQGTADENLKYVGICKILKAYTYSQLVDIYGDVPFSEADQIRAGVTFPKFDDDAEIYPQLFTLIDAGITDLNNEEAKNILTPGTDDVIYGGDVDLWIKAANTIKLKLYTQIRKVQDVSAPVTALLAADNLISSTEESFLLPYGPSTLPDNRNPGFNDYYAGQRSNNISPWFYEILKGWNPNINKDILDPRIPYYFFNQIIAGDPAEVGIPQTEYRDDAFVSIYFGSVGPDRDRSQQDKMTILGIYPVGGRYDDGEGAPTGSATSSDGTGAAPYRFITYADRLYLEAELINAGVITGDAKAKLSAAMDASFQQVDYVISEYVKPAQTVPLLDTAQTVADYKTEILTDYDAASTAKKLEIIMTEKWISSFGSAVDQYTDYRRTGYPVLFDPANPAMAPGGKVQPPIDGDPNNPGAQKAVPVQALRPYSVSLPWYQSELERNPNAPPQKNPTTYKVFWMP